MTVHILTLFRALCDHFDLWVSQPGWHPFLVILLIWLALCALTLLADRLLPDAFFHAKAEARPYWRAPEDETSSLTLTAMKQQTPADVLKFDRANFKASNARGYAFPFKGDKGAA